MSPDSAIDRKSIRRREKAVALANRQRGEVLISVMSTAPGRQWIWDILATCHIFHTTFAPGQPDVVAFAEGRRSVGLTLLADILATCPDVPPQAGKALTLLGSTLTVRWREAQTGPVPTEYLIEAGTVSNSSDAANVSTGSAGTTRTHLRSGRARDR